MRISDWSSDVCSSDLIDSARLMRGKGIDDSGLSINWADLMKHKRGFTDPVPQNMEAGLARNGVETIHGTATFETENRLVIDARAHESRHFLTAPGARPRRLGFPGQARRGSHARRVGK